MALGVFMGAIEFYNGLQSEKKVEDFQIFLTQQGDLNAQQGQMVVQGTPEQISALVERDDYRELVMKASHVVTTLNVQQAVSGDLVMQRVEQLQKVRKELGIIK
jgi:hypothetical protein